MGTNGHSPTLIKLSDEMDALTPEARKAARYVLENPRDAGVLSLREIAEAANVKPNTLVRMARQIGFDGYEDFREPIRQAILSGQATFTDRARWLQEAKKRGVMGQMYADMVASALQNIEKTFSAISEEDLQAAARCIWNSRRVYTLGVGVNYGSTSIFTYLASTAMVDFEALPKPGSTATDDLFFANDADVLIAITLRPYRSEIIDAVRLAKQRGTKVIAVSDSLASPIVKGADYVFIVSPETPQFFPSSAATIVLFETLLSFIIANASDDIVKRVEQFHQSRLDLGFYREES